MTMIFGFLFFFEQMLFGVDKNNKSTNKLLPTQRHIGYNEIAKLFEWLNFDLNGKKNINSSL